MSDSYDDYEAGVHSGRQFARAEGRELPLPDQPTQSDNTQPNSKIDPKTRISNDVVLSDNTLDDLITTCDFKPDETGSRICYWCGERKGSKIHTLKAHLYRVKVDKYAGGDEEKYKELMRGWQKKSRKHYSGNGGIRSLTPAQHKAMSIKGGQSRWRNREKTH